MFSSVSFYVDLWVSLSCKYPIMFLFFVGLIKLYVISVVGIDAFDDTMNELPDCSVNGPIQSLNRVILVSTLDGSVTAVNADADNAVMWTISTGPGPLLSSSIHEHEMTSQGQWVRMIPSLSGGLYKFNGVNVESIFLKADFLLHSSYLLSDGLIISGGRESRIYGIDMNSGQILYECSMQGCENSHGISNNVVIIQRHTLTIRAIDVNTGYERWNFSVGEHDVQLPFTTHCHVKLPKNVLTDFHVNAIIPEGLVYATTEFQPRKLLWKRKFDSPVVAVWKLRGSTITPVDLFPKKLLSFTSEDNQVFAPVLYVGVHNKQPYIQEKSLIHDRWMQVSKYSQKDVIDMSRIPWGVVSATSTALEHASIPDFADGGDDGLTTALSILHDSDYASGNGYFLFNDITKLMALDSKCDASEEMNATNYSTNMDELFDNNVTSEPYVFVIFTSLCYWWKEVFILSVATAMLVNLLVTERILRILHIRPLNSRQKIPLYISKPVSEEKKTIANKRTISENDEFTSRYLVDFEPVQCLGKGGFGAVIEARNKIDECHYAIKRIQLTNRVESRDRVLREVKALAKLDHPHIVRYFNSWMECPPYDWLQSNYSPYCKPFQLDGSSSECSDSNEENSHSANDTDELYSGKSTKYDAVASTSGMFLYIQMQLCHKESLREWLYENMNREKQKIMGMFEQILQAVEYIHSEELIHRDLKPSNIFFSLSGQIKVGDFGLVTAMTKNVGKNIRGDNNTSHYGEKHTTHVGTHLYMSPEQVKGLPYNYKVDIYSLGVILFELLCPFCTQMERYKTLLALRENIFPPTFMHEYKDQYDILSLMLSHTPEKRPTTNNIRMIIQ